MKTLLKYEFKKTMISKIIILIALAIAQVLIMIGHFTHNGIDGNGFILYGLTVPFGGFMIGIMSIITLLNDLSNNHSYMLFMTPHSSYAILGAKVLENALSLFLFAVISIVMIIADFFMYGGYKQNLIHIDWPMQMTLNRTLGLFGYALILWLSLVCLIILSIVIQATLFKDAKHNFLLSLLIFIGLSIILGMINSFVSGLIPHRFDAVAFVILNILVIIGTYIGAAALMDHQLSL